MSSGRDDRAGGATTGERLGETGDGLPGRERAGRESVNGIGRQRAGPHGSGRQDGLFVEMQRRRLVVALVELIDEQGLEGASVGTVCKHAGVSRRTFYEIFEDREACLLAAFEEAVERIAKGVRSAYESERGWRARIRSALTVLLERLDADPALARLCVIETLKAGPEVSRARANVLATLVCAVEQGRRESRQGSEPPPLAGQGVVGGALSVIHERLQDTSQPPGAGDPQPRGATRTTRPELVELSGSLMAMIVHPYLGAAAARRELERPTPQAPEAKTAAVKDPFKDLPIRFTYRTARVLATIAADPGASNRVIANISGIHDEGQMSRLLTRLRRSGLVQNNGKGHVGGEPNAWRLTPRGQAIHETINQPRT